MKTSVAALSLLVATLSSASCRDGNQKAVGDAADSDRERFGTRERQYEELSWAVVRAEIKNAAQFLQWLPTQPFPEDFKAEVRAQIKIAVEAGKLAWNDVKRHPDEVLLKNGLRDRCPIKDMIRALRRIGREQDAQDLALRFAYRADDERPAPANPRGRKRNDRKTAAGFKELQQCDAVEWLCESGNREAAEQVVKRLAARGKPSTPEVRRVRRRLYREVGDLQAKLGDVDAALKTHRLADDLRDDKPDFRPYGTLAWAIYRKKGFEAAMEFGRGVSIEFEQTVLNMTPPQLPFDSTLRTRREDAYWKLLPRLAALKEVEMTAADLAADFVSLGDFAGARRVMERAGSSSIVRCDGDDAERLLLNPKSFAHPKEGERLAKLLLDLEKSDAKLSDKDRSWIRLDVALFFAKIGRSVEARRLGDEAKRLAGDDDALGRFELLDLLLGSADSTWRKLNEWMKEDFGRPIEDTLLEWDLPDDFLRELLRRLEDVRTSDEGPSSDTKNEMIALVAAKAGMQERAKAALKAMFDEDPRYSARFMTHCHLEDFGWGLIGRMPFKEDSAARAACAADLANYILGIRFRIE